MTAELEQSNGPRMAHSHGLTLPAAADDLLARIFAGHTRVVIDAELGGGFSGSRVFTVIPYRDADTPELPAVVKLAPATLIDQEYRAYQRFIRGRLSGVPEIWGEPVFTPDRTWGGLRYSLIGSGLFNIESLARYCAHASVQDIVHVVESRLFVHLGAIWRQAKVKQASRLRDAGYDALLPVNLVIQPLPPAEGAAIHQLTPDLLDRATLAQGDHIRLEGFVVTKLDEPGRAVTLDAPSTAGEPAASFRLRLLPVDQIERYLIGEPLPEPVTGIVTATRQDLLAAEMRAALGPEIDLTADHLRVRGRPDRPLPNPPPSRSSSSSTPTSPPAPATPSRRRTRGWPSAGRPGSRVCRGWTSCSARVG